MKKLSPCTYGGPVNKSKKVFKYFLDGGEMAILHNTNRRLYNIVFGIYFNNKRVGEITLKTDRLPFLTNGKQYSLKEIKKLLLK